MRLSDCIDKYFPAADRTATLADIEGRKKGQVTAIDEILGELRAEREDILRQVGEAGGKKVTAKIDDFGEKIGGARKDVYQALKDTMASVDKDSLVSLPLSKVWPEPDYLKMIGDGADKQAVSIVRAMRDSVPDKPRTSWKVKAWADKVAQLAKFAGEILDGQKVEAFVKEARKIPGSSLSDMMNIVDLYEAVGHGQSLKWLTFKKATWSESKGEGKWVEETKWVIERPKKASSLSNWPETLVKADTKEEAIEAFKERLSSLPLAPEKSLSDALKKFDIYQYRGDDKPGFFIGVKRGRTYIDLEKFDTAAEAKAYRKENADKLGAKLKVATSVPRERGEANRDRIGQPQRDGDVTGEMFKETFGFRGGEFGNWVNNDERQWHLNNAYDALYDLSLVLGIPQKALSLNGELAIAFGARGKGGKDAPSAHYEADKIVINLTKRSGPGSLAHEWFHAVDNYFSRSRGRGADFISEHAYIRIGEDDKTRKELVDAFEGIHKAIAKTDLIKRSKTLDNIKNKKYWATGLEYTARSFENYVVEKLQGYDVTNDYLANISNISAYSEAMVEGMAAGKQATDVYPYLLKEELPGVVKAFDTLFETIKTKKTDKGVALYSKSTAPSRLADIRAELSTALGKLRTIKLLRGPVKLIGTQEEALRIAGHVDDKFSKRLDLGVSDSDMVEVGATPTILVSLGASNLKLYISGRIINKITKGTHKGELGIQGLMQVQAGIYDPIAVFSSGDNAMVVVTEVSDNNGNRVIVPIHLSKESGRNRVNWIKSIYGRSNFKNWFASNLEQGNLLYLNKKKAESSGVTGWHDLLSSNDKAPVRGQKNLDSGKIILTEDDVVNENNGSVKYSKDGRIQGFSDGKNIYLVEDGISEGDAYQVFLHETAHLTRLNFKSTKAWERILASVEKQSEVEWSFFAKARAAIPKDTAPENFAEEILAYAVENNRNDIGVVRQFIALVKKTLAELGINIDLNENDLKALAVIAARGMSRPTVGEAAGALFSKTSQFKPVDITSAAFRRWFGDSRVVDAEGKPLVVYHGTKATDGQFEMFDLKKAGSRTDSGYMGKGFYFSDERVASVYAGHYEFDPGRFPEGGAVYPVYLSIKNPLILMDRLDSRGRRVDLELLVREAVGLGKEATSDAVHDKAASMGFDGAIYQAGKEGYKEYVAFSPTQIKSAISNTGEFSRADPRIKFSKKAEKQLDEARGDERPEPLTMDEFNANAAPPIGSEDDPYTAIQKLERNTKLKVIRAFKKTMSDIVSGADKYLGATSTRLRNISEELGQKYKKLDFDTGTKYQADVKAVLPLLQKAKKKMSRSDFAVWDYARKNGDVKKIEALVKTYDLQAEYAKYRETLNLLRDEGNHVGMDIGWITEYAPRTIKDPKGFLNELGKGDDWPVISRALEERAKRLGITVAEMTFEMKADVISNMMFSGGGGTKPGNVKERKIKFIPPNLVQYYMDSDSALMHYLYSMRKNIEKRKFFGRLPIVISDAKNAMHAAQKRLRVALREAEEKEVLSNPDHVIGEPFPESERIKGIRSTIKEYRDLINKYKEITDYTTPIQAYIWELIEEGKLDPQHQKEVLDILRARFNEHGTRGVVQAWKNLSYIDVMGSPISALTQIGDLAWHFYEHGPLQGLKWTAKAAVGKVRITREDVGISQMAQEFADADTMSKVVSWVFSAVGLEKMDTIGKESFLNASLEKYEKLAATKPELLKKQISAIFQGDTDSVIDDLQNKRITDNVKLLVYSRLLDFQPVALSEQSEKYLQAGNGRVFYMLKTYTLKQFDIYRRESYNKIKSGDKKQVIEGIRNIMYLSMLLVLANAGADELKDLILGRKTTLEDRTVDNVLRLFGVSKFITWQARTEGVGTALAKQILPPFKFVNSLYKDISSAGDEKGLDTLASVPIVGKLAYWHMGKGVDNQKDLSEIKFFRRKRELVNIKEKVERNPELTAKYRPELTALKKVNKVQAELNELTSAINKLKAKQKQTGVDMSARIRLLERKRLAIIARSTN